MPLLEIKSLTMRFGGVTAVSALDLSVEEGQIFSVIGPNGAGKTTVFNAVTGIYEPTEGTIAVNDRPAARPFTWRVLVAAVCVGLLTAIALVLAAVNVDMLWRASVRRTAQTSEGSFSYAEAVRAGWAYIWGNLALERSRTGRWTVVSADGKIMLGMADTKEAALRLLQSLEGRLAAGDFADHPQLTRVAQQRASQKRWLWLALASGLPLGCLATLAIWRRGRRAPEVVARAGVARTFQNIRLFKNMTALENVLVGMDRAPWRNGHKERALELLDFVGLVQRAFDGAGDLPYGDQRRLEIARALATEPRLLLLDEPAAGMNPTEAAELVELVRHIRARGVTVLLIEHHMNIVMAVSDRVAVLDYGVKIAEGTPAEVRAHPRVIEAYLGKEDVG